MKKTLLKEMKSDLVKVKAKILIDLADHTNVDYKTYMKHLGEEAVLIKYIFKLEKL